MRTYKLYKTTMSDKVNAAMYTENGTTTSFFFDPANTDYQAYLKWLEEGGVPTPADE